jgi:bifunctional non-homologous end joining protein LigD
MAGWFRLSRRPLRPPPAAPTSTRPRILRSMPSRSEILTVAGREVAVSNPDKVFFPDAAGGPITKLELVRYYVAVAGGALRGAGGRPMALKRYPNGTGGDFFFQKRAPAKRPEWLRTVELRFPSGRTADEIVVDDAAGLAWVANLGCLDLNPHPVRADDLDHPDELRVDLDPVPGVPWDDVRRVALVVREALADGGLVGWPKTSGGRGIHVNVRIERRWTFPEVRRAALALARDVERRAPALATSRWWKEERHGVFIDYNQNAKDRTVASAYSVRPRPDARVSAPLGWDEVADVDPAAFTLRTVPDRFVRGGDPHAGIDDATGSLDGLLELSARHETEGLGDAPWPPNFANTLDEPPRVQPSKRRMSTKPLIEIGRAAKQADAIAGLERWKARHPDAWPHLRQADVLVDAMRGRSTTWTRIRLNLENVPPELRPAQEPLDPNYDPWQGVEWPGKPSG